VCPSLPVWLRFSGSRHTESDNLSEVFCYRSDLILSIVSHSSVSRRMSMKMHVREKRWRWRPHERRADLIRDSGRGRNSGRLCAISDGSTAGSGPKIWCTRFKVLWESIAAMLDFPAQPPRPPGWCWFAGRTHGGMLAAPLQVSSR